MLKAAAFILPLFFTLLSACGSTPQPPALSLDHAYGASAPASAQMLAPEAFQHRLGAGEITLIRADDAELRRTFSQGQQTQDLSALKALPDKSAALQAFLSAQPDAQPTPDGDLIIQPTGTDGKARHFFTLGTGTVAHALVGAAQLSRDPANALEVYRSAYRLLKSAQQSNLPTPDSLSGASITELKKALSSLDAAQGKVPDLDGVRSEPEGTGGVKGLAPLNIGIAEGQQPAAGHGADNTGVCAAPSPDGLLSRLRWPLKTFVSPIKDQGYRGTCWAFSSVGALETRALVTAGTSLDLSEQHFNNLRKLSSKQSGEGDWPRDALNDLAGHGSKVVPESAWTYNPSLSRLFGGFSGILQNGVCTNYSGLCSENIHQNPVSCTVSKGVTFCGLEPVVYSGGAAQPVVTSNLIWDNVSGTTPLPLNVIRTLLYNGTELILSFDVTGAFVNLGKGGYLTSVTTDHYGGHAVQVVGFIPDNLAPFAPAVVGGTGGGWFVIKNSWGCTWGDAGYGYLPVNFIKLNGWELDALSMPSTRSPAFLDVLDTLKATNPPPPVVTGVSVSGGPLDLYPDESADFRAVVSGTGITDPDATWTLTPTVGTLSRSRGPTVHYTAPAVITADQRVTLTATPVDDPGQSASIMFTLHPTVVPGTVKFSSVKSAAGTFTSFDPSVPIPVLNVVTVTAALQAGTAGVERLELMRRGVLLGSLTLTPPLAAGQSGSATLSGDLSGAPPGPTTLMLFGYDRAGNEVARASISVTVQVSQPVIGTPNPGSLSLSAPTGGRVAASLTFANTGTAPLTADVTPAAPWLTVLSNSPAPLAPGQTATVSLQATCPATPQVLNTTLLIAARDSLTPSQTVNVSLTCLAPPLPTIGDPAPAILELYAAPGATVTGSLTFSNTGSAPLSADVKGGINSAWLTVVSNAPRPLSPGQTATVTLQAVCPATPQALSTALTITANDSRVPDKQATVNLTCTDDTPLGVGVTAVSTQNVRPFSSATNPTVLLGKVAFSGYVLAGTKPVTSVKLINNGTVLSQNAVSVPAGSQSSGIHLLDLDTTLIPNGLYNLTLRAVDSSGAFLDTGPLLIRINNGGGPSPSSEIYSLNGVPVGPDQAPVIVHKSFYKYDVNLYGGTSGYSGALYLCLERGGFRVLLGQLPFGPQTGQNYPVPVNGVTPLELATNSDQIAITDTSNGNYDALFISGNSACDIGASSNLPSTSIIRVIFTN